MPEPRRASSAPAASLSRRREAISALVAEIVAKLPPGAARARAECRRAGLSCRRRDHLPRSDPWLAWRQSRALCSQPRPPSTCRSCLRTTPTPMAVAETYRVARKEGGTEDCLVVLIENGVGGGIVGGGGLHRGRLLGAGEIGHIPIGDAGFVYDALRPGRLETYVGKDALFARYRHVGGSGRRPSTISRDAVTRGEPAAVTACARLGALASTRPCNPNVRPAARAHCRRRFGQPALSLRFGAGRGLSVDLSSSKDIPCRELRCLAPVPTARHSAQRTCCIRRRSPGMPAFRCGPPDDWRRHDAAQGRQEAAHWRSWLRSDCAGRTFRSLHEGSQRGPLCTFATWPTIFARAWRRLLLRKPSTPTTLRC